MGLCLGSHMSSLYMRPAYTCPLKWLPRKGILPALTPFQEAQERRPVPL